MKNQVQDGTRINAVAGAAIVSGEAVMIGLIMAIAAVDLAIGEDGSFATEGVFRIPKVAGAGEALAQGEDVNFITASKSVTGATPGAGLGFTGVGTAWEAAADGDLFAVVKLSSTRPATAT